MFLVNSPLRKQYNRKIKPSCPESVASSFRPVVGVHGGKYGNRRGNFHGPCEMRAGIQAECFQPLKYFLLVRSLFAECKVAIFFFLGLSPAELSLLPEHV